ncbi:MAG TPA: hypothetical protein DCZ03_14725 [Gammaproteobacteria bacterium]|nr:hypothetical protein [Gammaproteobacteria bacterium]
MQLTSDELVKLIVKEIKIRKLTFVILFSLISLSFLSLGAVWPKKYESSVSIQYEDDDIIMPLMRGAAEATQIKDQAQNVRSIIFGRSVMKKILEVGGWLGKDLSAIEQEQQIKEIIKSTNVKKEGRNIVVITYTDKSAERAYVVTKNFGELFVDTSSQNQRKQSRDAYDFINKQVESYRKKLTEAENNLKIFQSENADAKPGMKVQVDERIVHLRRVVDTLTLEQSEAEIKLNSLQRQLSGEARVTANVAEKGEIYARIRALQAKLDQLRLSYLDTYPDIIRIKRQIKDLTDEAGALSVSSSDTEKTYVGFSEPAGDVRVSSLYDELKAQISSVKTDLLTLNNRLIHNRRLLEEEKLRAERINNVEAKLAELTRDYEVNRDIYKDLLRRRENARVSLNLDLERRGLSFKITEPANFPILPSGVRFIHFMLIGIIMGILIPVGLIFSLLYFGSKLRLERNIYEDYDIPLIETVPKLYSPAELNTQRVGMLLIVVLLLGDLSIFVGVGWMKYLGVPILDTLGLGGM